MELTAQLVRTSYGLSYPRLVFPLLALSSVVSGSFYLLIRHRRLTLVGEPLGKDIDVKIHYDF